MARKTNLQVVTAEPPADPAPEPAAEPPAGDSAGISPAGDAAAVLVTVKLAELAPHPRNPRQQLGDLSGLTASIKAHGLYEPLVVITAAAFNATAEAAGDPERMAGKGTAYVTLMGHRRAAAAAAAVLAEVPAVVRDDLAPVARAVMVAENLHREDLTPLEEAAGMAELAAAGWGQRKIAEHVGCGQSHVSKRLALLRLPEVARDALAAGTLTAADAGELHKLTGNGGRDEVTEAVIIEAVEAIGQGYHPEIAVNQARSRLRAARQAEETRAQLERDGVEVVPEERVARRGWARLYGDADTGKHRKAGCLAAFISSYSGEASYVCTNPASHPASREGQQARLEEARRETERESRKATKARDAACQQLAAGRLPGRPDLLAECAAVMLSGQGGHDALSLAYRWLRDSGAVPKEMDPHQARRGLAGLGGDVATLKRYAFAYCLAVEELHARSRGYGMPAWSARHSAHVQRLTEDAGYQPTAWEARQIAQQQAVQDAAGTLACTECGCTGHHDSYGTCQVRWDDGQGQPVHGCGGDCTQHKAWKDGQRASDGEGPAGAGEEE
jgi:ParB/RepB/Spo0J family partition protein